MAGAGFLEGLEAGLEGDLALGMGDGKRVLAEPRRERRGGCELGPGMIRWELL